MSCALEAHMSRVAASVVTILALATAAHAQVVTGSVIGTVRDESGLVLPGVTVTLSTPARPSISQTTGPTGEYRFPQVEAGTYTLTVAIEAFSTYTEEGFLVEVGSTTARNVTLKLATVAESINVKGESPMVDPRRVGVTANVKREVIDILPTQHDRVMEFSKWVPGVSSADPSGSAYDLAVMGSGTGENMPLVDGAPQQGRGDPETVLEIQAITLGASAEYQVAAGGVFNVVSKSGTNNLHLISTAYWWPDALVSSPVHAACPCVASHTTTSGYHRPVNKDYGGHLGGSIVKDRLWFFTGGNYFHREETQPGTDPNLLPRPARFNHGLTWNMDWRISDKIMLKERLFNAIWERPEGPGLSSENRTGLTVAAPFETILKSGGHVFSTNAHEVDITLTPTTLLVFRDTGTWNPNQYQLPLSGNTTTSFRTDTGTGLSCCGVSAINVNEAFTHQQAIKLNRYIQGARSTHDVRVGAQFTRESSWTVQAWPGGTHYSDLNGQHDQATFSGPSITAGKDYDKGVWAEDQVTMGRVTVSLGARFDHLTGVSPDMPTFDNNLHKTGGTVNGLGTLLTQNVWAPRLGGNVRLTEDGRLTMRFSAGRSYAGISPGDLGLVFPGQAKTSLYRWNPATSSYSTFVSTTDPVANIRFDSSMKPTYTDAYSIGFDRELVANVAVGATYVHKHGNDYIGWVDIGGVYGTRVVTLQDGRTVTVFPLLNATSQRIFQRTNGPGTFMTYNGLILTLDKRFTNHWRGSIGYTRSSSTGMVTTGMDPNSLVNNVGGLSPQDRPNMVVANSQFDVPKIDTQFAISFMSMGGRPFAPQAQINLPQGRLSVNIESPGSYRYHTQNILSMRASRALFRKGAHRVLLNFAVDNILQDTGEQSFVTQNFYSPNFAVPASWIEPRQAYFQLQIR
jgi:hypothetical protein